MGWPGAVRDWPNWLPDAWLISVSFKVKDCNTEGEIFGSNSDHCDLGSGARGFPSSPNRPERLWGPPSFLFFGYRSVKFAIRLLQKDGRYSSTPPGSLHSLDRKTLPFSKHWFCCQNTNIQIDTVSDHCPSSSIKFAIRVANMSSAMVTSGEQAFLIFLQCLH